MKNIYKNSIFFLLMAFAVSSCTRQYFGVDEDIWETLSEEQKTIVIKEHAEREKIRAKNEVKMQAIEGAADTIHVIADLIVNKEQNDSLD